jgi:hypothetical protein
LVHLQKVIPDKTIGKSTDLTHLAENKNITNKSSGFCLIETSGTTRRAALQKLL